MTAPTETASTTTERARDYFKGLLIEAEIRRRLLRNYPGEPAVWADEIRAHLDSKVPDHDHEYYVKVGNGTL